MKNLSQNRRNQRTLAALAALLTLTQTTAALAQTTAGAIHGVSVLPPSLPEKSARGREAEAQYEFGRRCEHGIGIAPNARDAARWYRLAADQGLARAQYSLARLYFSGEGVRLDQAAAASLFRQAARQGCAPAQNRLARCYEFGLGLAPDLTAAYEWYNRAAANRLVSGQVNLQALTARMTARSAQTSRLHLTADSIRMGSNTNPGNAPVN
jgi:TPR repeat protein